MAPISRTELQDLPIEILDYILMKAVVKKVMDRKLVKSFWLNYASRVIQPMRTVWSRWNYSLATNWFRTVLSRILSNKDPAAISVSSILVAAIAPELCDLYYFVAFAKLGNHIYLASIGPDDDSNDDSDNSCLLVFEVQDLSRCTKTIPLPASVGPPGMAACEQSKSIYVWGYGPVLHLVPDGNEGFEMLYWPPYSAPSDFLHGSDPSGDYYRINSLSVLDDGNLLVQRCITPNVDPDHAYHRNNIHAIRIEILSVHRPDGFVVRNIKLPMFCESSNVMMKSNGNFVYANVRDAIVTEVDRDGKEVSCSHWKGAYGPYKHLFLDSYDRVILLDAALNFVFLDAGLNFIDEVPLEVELEYISLVNACFYKETSEFIIFSFYGDFMFVKLAL